MPGVILVTGAARYLGGILAESLEGVDRELLYPAVQAVLRNDDPVARGSLSRLYGKLTDEDLVVLLPAIVQAVENLAPSNEMFGDGIMSAIDFTLDMEKVTGSQGEARCKITLNGKWLEYKTF